MGILDMWNAISYVTSGLALVAFMAAVTAWSYRSKTQERERLIRSAKEGDRGELVRNALEFFNIDAVGLTKEQQFRLALEQIQARGRRFMISAGVVCFLAVVAVTIAAYAITQHGRFADAPTKSQSPSVDPALVGSWEAEGKIETMPVQLRLQIGADGKYSRLYLIDDGGVIDAAKGKLRLTGVRSAVPAEIDYAFVGSDTLVVTQRSGSREFKRDGQVANPQDLLVGTWKAPVLWAGATVEFTIEIGPQHNFHIHAETSDNGDFKAHDGKWEMISKWAAVPIVGTYKVASGNPEFTVWPFGRVELKRPR
jgi:hypothetical protein